MISKTEQTLAIIPARGGSKGIPGKNIKLLGGRPLLEYTAEFVKKSGLFADAILSTDCEEIADCGRECGLSVPFLRPPELATDTASVRSVVSHLLKWLDSEGRNYDYLTILQPTSPFRSIATMKQGLERLWRDDCDSVVGVMEIPGHFSPQYAMKINELGYLENYLPEGKEIVRRQDVLAAFSRSGALYAFRTAMFLSTGDIYGEKCIPLRVTREESINTDLPEDWEYAEWIWQKMKEKL